MCYTLKFWSNVIVNNSNNKYKLLATCVDFFLRLIGKQQGMSFSW